MIKAVLFDLGNTLYPYEPSHRNGFYALLNFLEMEWGIPNFEAEKLYLKAREEIQRQLHDTAASHHRLLYMIRICELLGKNPLRYAQRIEKIYWNAYFETMRL